MSFLTTKSLPHTICKRSLLRFGLWSVHLVRRFRESLIFLICWISGTKRSLTLAVIERLRFSRSTFETAKKIGKSSPKSIIASGFVIVSVFLLEVTRSFFMLSAKNARSHADSPKQITCKVEYKKCGTEFRNDTLMAAVQFNIIQMN